jgi:hypothetical protein
MSRTQHHTDTDMKRIHGVDDSADTGAEEPYCRALDHILNLSSSVVAVARSP